MGKSIFDYNRPFSCHRNKTTSLKKTPMGSDRHMFKKKRTKLNWCTERQEYSWKCSSWMAKWGKHEDNKQSTMQILHAGWLKQPPNCKGKMVFESWALLLWLGPRCWFPLAFWMNEPYLGGWCQGTIKTRFWITWWERERERRRGRQRQKKKETKKERGTQRNTKR